jgi:hypothetical protein
MILAMFGGMRASSSIDRYIRPAVGENGGNRMGVEDAKQGWFRGPAAHGGRYTPLGTPPK